MTLDPATLRAWREARGLSQQQAAETLGVNKRTLEGLEYGRYPRSPLWGALARVIQLLPAVDAQSVPRVASHTSV